MKIVCFVLSYKIIKLGYILISSGVKGEFKFSSNFIGFKADLASVSPGLLFILLGVLLMMVAVYTNKTISYQKDKAPTKISKDSNGIFKDTTLTPQLNDFKFEDSSSKK